MKPTSLNAKTILIFALLAPAVASHAADGKALFEKNCAICHGVDGTGQMPMGLALQARNFTDAAWQDKVKDEEIVKTIQEGRLDKAGKEKMKPFGKILPPDDIKTLVGYIRQFKGKASAPPPRVLDISPNAPEPGGAAAAGVPAAPSAAAAAPSGGGGGGAMDLILQGYLLASLGSPVEQQNALATLTSQPTPAVDTFILQALDKLLAGQVRPEMQLDLLELARKRTAPIIKEKIQKFETSRSTVNPLAAYSDVAAGGNADAGHNVFFDNPASGCIACHMINGKGGAVGPNLTGIGARRSREYLLEAMVDPNKEIADGFLVLSVTTKDGKKYSGTVQRQTDLELVLNSPEDGEIKIAKANIANSTHATSPMPPDLAKGLPRRDLRDLLEYLCSLKETPATPFPTILPPGNNAPPPTTPSAAPASIAKKTPAVSYE